jgi:FkbM family methyltransferase
MTLTPINNFTVLDTVYGKWIVNRHAQYHAETFIKTGYPVDPDLTGLMISIVNTLPDNCVVVDGGANTGVVSVPLAHAVKDRGGQVYSFEVQRSLFYALCGTAALNDLDNLNVFNCGLGAEATTLSIDNIDYSQPQDFGMVSLVDQSRIQQQQDHSAVDIVPIDQLGLDRLDFLKLDVEGMEIEILKGAENTIRTHRPWAYIEFWTVGKAAVMDWFKDMDYSFYQIKGADVICCPNEKLSASGLTFNAPKW